jgi:RNA polymerase sigma-70 factor (ECF subfamily)
MTVLGAVKDDQEAWTDVYRSFLPRVRGLCLHLLGSVEDAEDAAGEVFLKLRRTAGACDGSAEFASRLLRSAANHCLDRLRRRRLERRLFSEGGAESVAVMSRSDSPLGELLFAERRLRLRRAIAALPGKYRVPLALRYYGDLSYEEIGRHLALKPVHVGVLLLRAKQELRRALTDPKGEPRI